MAPSSTSSGATVASTRPTRTSSRTNTATPTKTAPAAAAVKSKTATTTQSSAAPAKAKKSKAAASVGSAKKRQQPNTASKSSSRKRAKRGDSEDDDEQEEEEEEDEKSGSADQEDGDDYEDGDDDDEVDDDSDADDFQDTTYGRSTKSRSNSRSNAKPKINKTSTAKSTKATSKQSSSTTKSKQSHPVNSDLLPAPTPTFLVSKLKIPHPRNGPVADAIQPETLEFIRDLKLNNDREYMELNKERFIKAKADFIDFIRMVKEGLLEADPDVMDQEPKDSMMRIYRDIRFSNDKSPYKSQMACHFSRGGKKSIAAGYYFGISSGGETFAGCGVWDPQGPVLTRIRHGLVNHSDRFKAILETEAIQQITGGKTGVDALRPGHSQLKTGPAGFDKDHPMIEFLKRKCFAVGRHFTDEQVVHEGFLEQVLQTFDAGVELVHILNEWIG